MEVYVDRDGCIGCGVCAQICPDVFQLDEEGLSEVIAKPDGFEDQVNEAAGACPVEVIHPN
ncbi:MAG: ferredoxin [Oscillospiraceae bacterium]|nr:ferredoxin [Oscillospiraceae bacterium]